ncbi:hypothetical protein D9M70_530310 [compost metagenome]
MDFFQHLLGVIRSLVRIASEQSLIQTLFGIQDRLIAQEDFQELKLPDVPTENNETNC